MEALEDALDVEATSTTKGNRWFLILPAVLMVFVGNVGIHVLYMVAYSYLISPGRDMAHYQAHAQLSGPYSSIVVGMLLMFLVCRWMGKKFAAESRVTAALLIWLLYILIDMILVMFAGGPGGLAFVLVISYATKFAAAYLGGIAARKQIVTRG